MSNKFVVEGGLSIPSGKQLELAGQSLSAVSNDTSLGDASQNDLVTEYAVKSYVDSKNQFTISTSDTGSNFIVDVDNTLNFDSDNALTWTLTEDNIALALDVDDSSIEISASNGVQVKSSGITNAMLAGSIASSKLAELSGTFSTTDLPEGDNQYYTDARVYSALSVSDTASVDMTVSASGQFSAAAKVDDSSIETSASNGLQVKASGITNTMLAGSIANNKLVNSTLSAGGVELTLGASDDTPAFDLSDATAYPGDGSLVTTGALDSGSITSGFGTIDIGSSTLDCGDITGESITMTGFSVTSTGLTTMLSGSQLSSGSADAVSANADIANKAYVDSKVGNADLDFQGDTGGALAVDLDSETLTIAGTANEIETAGSGQTITIGLPNDVTIGNDLTVSNDAAVTGTATFTAQSVHTNGIDCNGTLSMDNNNIEGTANDMLIQSGTVTDYDSNWSDTGHMALQAQREVVIQSGNRLENDFSKTMDNSTSGNVMFSFDGDIYDSAKVHIRMSDGTDTTTREILIATNAAGTSANLLSYGVVSTAASDIDGAFTVTVTDTNTVNLVCTQESASTDTVVGHYQLIK